MFERNRIAETLRSAREQRGLSLEQAAAGAGIPTQYVRLLEGETNVRVGVSDELYLIPFFRKYASFVGIDGEELLPEFLGMVQQAPSESNAPIRLAYRPRYASLWRPLAVVVSVVVAGVLLLRQPHERPGLDDGAGETSEASIAEPSMVPAVEARPTAETSPAAAGMESPAPPVAATSAATASNATTRVAPTEVAGGHELQISAKEEAWLALALDDQSPKQFMLRAGETRTWHAERFTVTIGNAGGVVLALDGRELGPVGKPGKVVRNLHLPEPVPSPTA